VVAAAVILKPGASPDGLNDSKQLTPAVREKLFDQIKSTALAFGIAAVEPSVIDRVNILQASFQAIRQALAKLSVLPQLVLFDGVRKIPRCSIPQETIVKGDGKSASIAAASVLAKVTRDRLMLDAHRLYPHYGFDQHKGYGTPQHQEALKAHGPCDLHRRSFAPVMNVVAPELPLH